LTAFKKGPPLIPLKGKNDEKKLKKPSKSRRKNDEKKLKKAEKKTKIKN